MDISLLIESEGNAVYKTSLTFEEYKKTRLYKAGVMKFGFRSDEFMVHKMPFKSVPHNRLFMTSLLAEEGYMLKPDGVVVNDRYVPVMLDEDCDVYVLFKN